MYDYHENFHFNAQRIVATVFAGSIFMLLFFPSHYSVFFLLLVLCMGLYPLLRPSVSVRYKMLCAVSLCISTVIYGLLFPYINQLELGGDEIGVIRISSALFQHVYPLVKSEHVLAMPLDYWFMHVWQSFVVYLGFHNQEFLYRIPYMVLHSISASFFGVIMLKEAEVYAKTKKMNISGWLSALLFFISYATFFANSLLFIYSIEVRFYSMSVLGSLGALYFFLFPAEYRSTYVYMLCIFSLNAFTQFIVNIVLFIRLRFHRKYMKLLSLAIVAIGFFLIDRRHFFMRLPVSDEKPYTLVINALYWVFHMQFETALQVGALILCSIFILYLKTKKDLSVIAMVILMFSVITASDFIVPYYDFHWRHYLFIIPWGMFVLFIPAVRLQGMYRVWFLIGLFLAITLPWGHQTYVNVPYKWMYTTSLVGAKEITARASKEERRIIIVPNKTVANSAQKLFYFNKDTLLWYAHNYPNVLLSSPSTPQAACLMFQETKRAFIVNVMGKIDCLSEDSQTKVFGTYYGVN